MKKQVKNKFKTDKVWKAQMAAIQELECNLISLEKSTKQLKERVQSLKLENNEVQTALSADNTVSNKEAFVFEKMEEEIAKYFTDSYDFYEKIQKDDIKSSIFKTRK